MASCKLSNEAEADLASLYRFGLSRFGLKIATDYAYSFVDFFAILGVFPEAYPEVPEIAAGLRRAVHRSHAIYFKILDDRSVWIVRILGRQDPFGALHEE